MVKGWRCTCRTSQSIWSENMMWSSGSWRHSGFLNVFLCVHHRFGLYLSSFCQNQASSMIYRLTGEENGALIEVRSVPRQQSSCMKGCLTCDWLLNGPLKYNHVRRVFCFHRVELFLTSHERNTVTGYSQMLFEPMFLFLLTELRAPPAFGFLHRRR